MSLYLMNPSTLYESENFYKEASDSVISKANQSKSKKIILTGPRCSGKSTVLYQYQKEQVRTGNDSIYVFSDPSRYCSYLEDNEMSYGYELYFCNHILNYIKNNYKDIYDRCFLSIYDDITKKSNEYIYLINNNAYTAKKYEKLLSHGALIEKIVNLMKKELGINKLTIMFDRFDWTGNSSKKFQKIVKYYLDMFDRYIITSDDKCVYEDEIRRQDLNAKGFDIINVDYGKKITTAKKIVSLDMSYWREKNKNSDKVYDDPRDVLKSKIYNTLIKKCNGDFGLLFDTLRSYVTDLSYGDSKDINKSILAYYEEALNYRRSIEDKAPAKKLHL